MLKSKVSVFLTTFFFISQLGIYHGVSGYYAEGSIEFYGSENYEDFLLQVYTNTSTKCNSVSEGNGTLKVKQNHSRQIGSIQLCTEENGGSNLHVDLITFYGDRDEVPSILESYRDVCSCHDMPEYVLNLGKWSIDNHGNEMVAYFERDCGKKKFEPVYIPAGHSTVSRGIYEYVKNDEFTNTSYRIQSFGPNLTGVNFGQNCQKPFETIMEIEFLEVLNSTDIHKEQGFDLVNENKTLEWKRVKFYERPIFQGFLLESNLTLECNNLMIPSNSKNLTDLEIWSIRTNMCILIYSSSDCKGRSVKIFPGEISELRKIWEGTVTGPKTLLRLYKTRSDWKWTLNSWRTCSDVEGGAKLNVDLTSFELRQQNMWESPYVWKKYRDVCSCQNIPKNLDNTGRFSVNNYGNSMMSYFGENCSAENDREVLWIPAGRSSYSIGFSSLRQVDGNRIQSFGPDINSMHFRKNCLKLYASVIKFEIDDRVEFEETNLNIDMFNNVFRNDGHNGISRTYFINNVVQETFHVKIGSSLDDMRRVLVEKDFEVESNFDQSVFRELAFREVLCKAYTKTEENSSRDRNFTLNSFKTFPVKQVLSIPPCTEHKFNAYVSMLRNDRIEFWALMKIRGFIDEREMVAAEVKQFMDNSLEYMGDYDEYNVLAYAKGIVGMTFGSSLVVEGEDFAIHECIAHNQLLSCPACEVCY